MIPPFIINKNKSVLEKINELLIEIPFFIRLVLWTKVLLFILNLFTNLISFYLSNIPLYTIGHYQFWRLITTSFITTNLINMIIGFIVWFKDAISLEKSIGTIRYIFIFITNSIFINLIYCFLIYAINYVFKNNILMLHYNSFGNYKINNSGIWPIIICEMTILCLNNPDSHIRFLFRPCPLKAKYYPIFIIIIYFLINNFRFNYGIVSGFLYGYIYYYLLQNKLRISDEHIKKIEETFCCKFLVGVMGFVNIDSVITLTNSGYVQTTTTLDNSQNGFSPFQGKGIAVGSTHDYIAVNGEHPNNTLEEIRHTENSGNENENKIDLN